MLFKTHYDHNPCGSHQVRDENNLLIAAHLTEHGAVLLTYHLNKGYRSGIYTVSPTVDDYNEIDHGDFALLSPGSMFAGMDGEVIATFIDAGAAEKVLALLNAMVVNKDNA
jgi:hypothetical protein